MRVFSWWRRLCQVVCVLSLICPLAVARAADQVGRHCADPAADFEVALVTRTGPMTGRVRITGIVRNLGSAAWYPTTPSHRLQMVLAQKDSAAIRDGVPVEPPIAITQLLPGQEFRIDHQMDWRVGKNTLYPQFIVWFFDTGQVGTYPASYSPDCHTDNDRPKITPADIDKLFAPPPPIVQPLNVRNYRLLGGVGVNTVQTILAYARNTAAAGKITASVTAPYSATASAVPITGRSGRAKISVYIPCDIQHAATGPLPPVVITYRLLDPPGLAGDPNWAVSFSIEQPIAYRQLCASQASGVTE
ncbi:MAG: hypothetical protein ACYC9J_00470 [Sulfuricaulis sp.]